MLDKLSGLLQYEEFLEKLEEELYRAKRFKRPLALLVLTRSKARGNEEPLYTKGYGTLRQLANILKKAMRDVDTGARVDGEILAATLPETDIPGARIVAERICREVAAQEFVGEDLDSRIHLTVNIAFACAPEHGDNAAELMAELRRMLVQADADGLSSQALQTESLPESIVDS